ncbi:MAG: peptidylprolyl isomerase [Vulcanibacillus sp.]
MNPVVTFNITNKGIIKVELYPEVAPITVNNFAKLVSEGFYNGIIFHRVIKGFMLQGGDPQGTGMGGSENQIKGEFKINGVENNLKHTAGVISMARTQIPDSASSQFFLMHRDSPHLDGSYAAFGKTIEGQEVIDAIATVQTDGRDKPLEDVIMETVTIELNGYEIAE